MHNRHQLRTCAVAVPILLGAAGHRAAGQSAPSRRAAVVAGVVFDSLVRNGPLSGAEVTIDGTEYATISDSKGRFKLDGIPAGRAVVRFYHAALDSLGFGAAPIAVIVPDSGVLSVRLTTPSPARLHASLCPGNQAASTGVILGRVRNIDDGAPLAAATASANWAEWTLGQGGLNRTDRRAAGVADANGSFALCGVPNDVPVVVRAVAGGHVTGLVEVDLGGRTFVVRDFSVSLADTGSSLAELAQLDSALARGESPQPKGTSAIVGVIRGPNGRLLDQAQVGVFGFPISTRTASEGTYALNGLPGGTQTVDVRAVGFAPKRLTIELRTGERHVLEIVLSGADAQRMAEMNIVGRGTLVDRSGFENRRKAGIGQYITADEIKRRGVFETTQALWNVLGARVVWDGQDNVVKFTRPIGSGRAGGGGTLSGGGSYNTLCSPAYWVDGFAMPDSKEHIDANTFVRPKDIRGIEVYIDPSAVPPPYRRPDVQCGVVLIWTKPPQPKRLEQPKNRKQ